MRAGVLSALALLMAGCGGEGEGGDVLTIPLPIDSGPGDGSTRPDVEPSVDAAPDMGLDMAPDSAPLPCAIAWGDVPDGPIGPGTRLEVTGAPGADLAARGPDGFAVHAHPDRENVWWVRVPYTPGPTDLSFTARCPDGGRETHVRTVEIRPMTWQPVTEWEPGLGGPPGREYFHMWADPAEPDTLWVYGGFHYRPAQFTAANDLWRMHLPTGEWTAVAADPEGPVVGGAGLALIPDSRRAVHYGGVVFEEGGSTLGEGVRVLDFGAEPPTWRRVPFERPVPGVYQPAVFVDGDRLVRVGGQGFSGVALGGQWLALDGTARGSLELTGDPPGRVGFAWGRVGSRLAIFSGEQGGGADGACNCAEDTWLLDFDPDGRGIWSRFDDAAQPPGRRNAVFGIDPVEQRLFVWGGTADGRTSVPGLSVLHLTPGAEAWVEIDVAGDPDLRPPPRSSGRAIYDAPRGRMVLGFGNGAGGVYTDLWALTL